MAEIDELLRRVAEQAGERWPEYAAFASLRARGLRQDALATVRRFAAQMKDEPFAARWELVRWLHDRASSVAFGTHTLVPFPLRVDVVVPTLREAQHAAEPPAEAFLWMARDFSGDIADRSEQGSDVRGTFLREAILRTGGDPRLKRALADHLLGIVEHNSHHLFESIYLGHPEDDLETLARARALLDDSVGREINTDGLRAEIDRAEQLVRAWQAYRATGTSDFATWCREQGIEPPGGMAFYYER